MESDIQMTKEMLSHGINNEKGLMMKGDMKQWRRDWQINVLVQMNLCAHSASDAPTLKEKML